MRPCGGNTLGAHPAVPGTRLVPHDHWRVDLRETESHCRAPDDNVLRGHARRSRPTHGAGHSFDACVIEALLERRTKLGISIVNEILIGLEDAPPLHGHIASDLLHPYRIRARRDPGNADLAGVELDEEQDTKRDEPAEGPDLGAEEVGGPQHLLMGTDELAPGGRLLSIWGRWKPSAFEDFAYRLVANLVAQLGQGAGNAVITPTAILLGHFHDEVFEFFVDSGAAHGLTLLGAIKFLGHQIAMPGQNRVGFNDVGNLRQGLFTQPLADLSQCSTLGVGEWHATLNPVSQNAIFGHEILISQA